MISGPANQTYLEIGDTLATGVDSATPFYGFIVTTAGQFTLEGWNEKTVNVGTLAVGTMRAGLHLRGYTSSDGGVLTRLI